MRRLGGLVIAAALAATLVPGSGTARASRPADVVAVSRGLDRAIASGRLAADEGAEYRRDLSHAADVLGRVSGGRHRNLAAVLHEVAAQGRGYTAPRALAL